MFKVILSLSLLLLLLLAGCVGMQSFPNAGRAGDTITLAVGSAEGMLKSNTILTYTPDQTGIPINIPANNLRAIVPIYPDKRTSAWSSSAAITIDSETGHGSWLTILVIDLPVTLPEGTGVINVQTAATYAPFASDVNNVNIALEVLPGNGSPDPFRYKQTGNVIEDDLAQIEVLQHYLIKPDFEPIPVFTASQWPTFGAVEITVTGNIMGVDADIDRTMRIVLDDMEQNLRSHVQMNWVRRGDVTTINLISSKGLLNYYEIRASIFFTDQSLSYSIVPVINERYFDINGNQVNGPDIKVVHVSN